MKSLLFLLLPVLSFGVALLPASSSARTWIVAADGSGDFELVSAAHEAAASGDSIMIMPGEYWEPDHDGVADPPIAVADKSLSVIGGGTEPSDVSLRLRITYGGSGWLRMSGLRFHDTGGALGVFLGQSVRMENCFFEDNDSGDGVGGAIECSGPDIDISSCAFYRNRARRGGAVAMVGDYRPEVTFCLFDGNFAAECGGAVFCEHAHVSSSIVTNNNAQTGAALEGYGDFEYGIVELEHNTFWRNNGASCIRLLGPGGVNLCIVANSQGMGVDCTYPTGSHCNCVYGNGGDDFFWMCDAGGNIDADPLFCDPEHGDFGLREDSPCRPGGFDGCGQIGARGVSCGESPVRIVTWGRIKSLYR